jgi:phosphotransferase system enzyme I (PtsI)
VTRYHGKCVFSGVAKGQIKVVENATAAAIQIRAENADAEWQLLINAKAETDKQLRELFEKTKYEMGEELANIIDVQRLMLIDGDLNDCIEALVKDESLTATEAVRRAGKEFSEFFEKLDDPYMNLRSADVLDVTNRLLAQLSGYGDLHELFRSTIIVAEDLMPSQTLTLDRAKISAFVLRKGSSNSHTAILARSLGIPCLAHSDIPIDKSLEGKAAIVDSEEGVLYVEPDEITSFEADKKIERINFEKSRLKKCARRRLSQKAASELERFLKENL